jgi:hypothetical protein
MKTPNINFVFHPNMHICSEYGGNFNKLFHDLDHDLAHLAWKPWNFVHDRSFPRRGFYNICNNPSLLFFLTTRSHNMTQCEGFTIFFWISYAWFKMSSKRRAWTFLASGWILQNYLWISDKISTCEPENDFWKKSWSNYDAALVQIYPTFTWIKTLNP